MTHKLTLKQFIAQGFARHDHDNRVIQEAEKDAQEISKHFPAHILITCYEDNKTGDKSFGYVNV
uniref:hypothetical protein n=1 Tax=Salmonella sp. SAL4355 TaxID=3159876 RepID=UPI00397E3A9E